MMGISITRSDSRTVVSVQAFQGTGSFEDENTIVVGPNQTKIESDNIVVATGARQRDLPGINIDGYTVITSRHALELSTLPKSVVIIGGGATGAEFAYLYRSYGVEVTIVEMMDRILPQEDQDVSTQLQRSFNKSGISIVTSAKVKSTQFLKKIYKKEKFPFSIARLFLTYGPGQKENRFIPQIIQGSPFLLKTFNFFRYSIESGIKGRSSTRTTLTLSCFCHSSMIFL